MFQVGDTVGSHQIVAQLKAGGMASLYLARRRGAAGFARPVVIKVVHPHLSSDATFVQMLVDEAKLCARIQHPNVVHVEELGEERGQFYLVMEYVHGCSLGQLLTGLAKKKRMLTPDVATYVAIELADGLHAAHETKDERGRVLGVVHRDVSPQNVLLGYAGHVKLIDFGIAKAEGRLAQTSDRKSIKGKLRYMAPEQAFGAAVDRRTDVYALGILLWEMLTMRRCFSADDEKQLFDLVRHPQIPFPSTINPAVTPELDVAVMRALSRNPAERPATAQEWRRQLAQAYPQALAVEADNLATLIFAVMEEEIAEQERMLPDSVSSVVGYQAPPEAHAVAAAGASKRSAELGATIVDRSEPAGMESLGATSAPRRGKPSLRDSSRALQTMTVAAMGPIDVVRGWPQPPPPPAPLTGPALPLSPHDPLPPPPAAQSGPYAAQSASTSGPYAAQAGLSAGTYVGAAGTHGQGPVSGVTPVVVEARSPKTGSGKILIALGAIGALALVCVAGVVAIGITGSHEAAPPTSAVGVPRVPIPVVPAPPPQAMPGLATGQQAEAGEVPRGVEPPPGLDPEPLGPPDAGPAVATGTRPPRTGGRPPIKRGGGGQTAPPRGGGTSTGTGGTVIIRDIE